MTLIRPFEERDRAACHRIWVECGWMKPAEHAGMDLCIDAGRAYIAEIRGEAECLVMAASGDLRYLDSELPLSAITGVTTSHIGRKQGLAAKALARLVASEAEAGAAVSGLGMFEQGFYNQLGYGTGAYLHIVAFDPGSLELPVRARIPYRLTKDDWREMHANRQGRLRRHGAVTLISAELVQAETAHAEHPFGFGFRDEATGVLTHHLWLTASDVESGPYRVSWMSYRTLGEFLELLAVLRNLGDQVRLVKMEEPPGIVIQDFLRQPFKQRQVSDSGKYSVGVKSLAPFQFRICDLPRCMAQTRLPWGEVRFNLELTDPIVRYLPDEAGWRGCGGEYVVTLGRESTAERGRDSSLPTLRASVNAFTRLWLGARTASFLAVSDEFSAPPELIRALEEVLRLPSPCPDWDF